MKLNQQGIAHLGLLVFLIAAVGIGSYLVQQRTNLTPYAQEGGSCEDDSHCPDLTPYCENGVTRQCGGGYCDEAGICQRACEIVEGDPLNCAGSEGTETPEDPIETSQSCNSLGLVSCTTEQANNGYVLNNDGYMQGDSCYRKIYQYEATTEEGLCCSTPLTPAADQAECKLDAQYTPGGGIGTTRSTESCPDEGLIYCDQKPGGMVKIEKYNSKWNEEKNECEYDFREVEGEECEDKLQGHVITAGTPKAVEGSETLPPDSILACTEEQLTAPLVGSKLQTNLLYYYAIITGTPERCVKSDLTLPEFIYADGVDGGTSRRLFTCSGKDGSIKFRVMSQDGKGLVQTTQNFPTDPNDPNFPGYRHVREAERKLGISL